MKIPQENLAFNINILEGHTRDSSGNGNHATILNAGGLVKAAKGHAYFPTTTASKLQIADSPTTQFTRFSFHLLGAWTENREGASTSGRLISKRDGGGINFDIFIQKSGKAILIYDGSITASLSYVGFNISKADVISFTHPDGTGRLKCYFDGVYVGEANSGSLTSECSLVGLPSILIL